MSSLLDAAPAETAVEAGGYVKGVAVALVSDNQDKDGLCRVKVCYPWHERPRESHWARLAMPMAGKDRGFVLIPEVGDEVLVAFEKGDLRFPYVIGAMCNGKDTAAFANTDGKNDKRILKSRKKHFLLFDDGSKGVVTLAHEKGRRIVLDDDGFTVEDEKGNVVKVESSSGAMTIEAKGQLKIKAASITIEATGTIDVKATSTMKLGGSLVHIN